MARRINIEKEQLLSDLLELRSAEAIAEKHGISAQVVRQRIKEEFGLTVRELKKKHHVDKDVLIECYQRHRSIQGVVREMKMDYKTVRKHLEQNGLLVKGKTPPSPLKANLDDTQIKIDYETGASAITIAETCGVSETTILKRLDALGVTRRKGGHTRPIKFDLPREELQVELDRLKSAAAIADKYGVHASTVRNAMKRLRVERTAIDQRELEEYFRQGLRTKQIADNLGVSTSLIRYYFRKYGIVEGPMKPGARPMDIDVERLMEDYAESGDTRFVANQHNTSPSVIRSRLAAAGVAVKRSQPHLTGADRATRSHKGFMLLLTATQCRDARLSLGYSQREMAHVLKVTPSVISHFECGRGYPFPGIQKEMVKFFKRRGISFHSNGIGFTLDQPVPTKKRRSSRTK